MRRVPYFAWAALAVVAALMVACAAATTGTCGAGSGPAGYLLDAVYSFPLDRYDFVFFDDKGGQLLCQVQQSVILNGLSRSNAAFLGYFGGECTCRGRRYAGRAVYSDAFENPPDIDVCQVCEAVAEAGPRPLMKGFDGSTLELEGKAGLTYTLLSIESKQQHEGVHANIQLASGSVHNMDQQAGSARVGTSWLNMLSFFRAGETGKQLCVSAFAVVRGRDTIAVEAREGAASVIVNGRALDPTERLDLDNDLVVQYNHGKVSQASRRQLRGPIPFLATHGHFPMSLLFGSSGTATSRGSVYVSHPLLWFAAEVQPSDQGCLKVDVGLYRPIDELRGRVQGLLGSTVRPVSVEESSADDVTVVPATDAEAFVMDSLTATFAAPNVYFSDYSNLAEQRLVSTLASGLGDESVPGSGHLGTDAPPAEVPGMAATAGLEDMMQMLVLEEEQLPHWVLQDGDAGSSTMGDVVIEGGPGARSDDSKQLLALQEKLLSKQQQGKWEETWLQAEEFGEEGDTPVLLRRLGTPSG